MSNQNPKNYIRFSENWNNKLTATYFTSIRPVDKNRYIIGNQYDIYLKHKMIKKAVLIQSLDMCLSEISERDICLDTGGNRDKFRQLMRMFYDDEIIDYVKFSILLFKTIDK